RIQFKAGEYGGTKQGLGLNDVKTALIPLPPVLEQHAICDALRTSLSHLDVVKNRAQDEISLARENRERLVSDVGNGKLDVRHLEADRVDADLEGIEALDEVDEGDDLDETEGLDMASDESEDDS